MSLPRPALVIFDCDGTLVDSQHAIVRSMQDAFVRCGLQPPQREAILYQVGLVLETCIENLLLPHELHLRAQCATAYRDTYRELRERGELAAPLYPGTAAMLNELERRALLMSIATGKSRRGLDATLEEHGLAHLFVFTRTVDEAPSKPNPQMLEDILYDCGVEAELTWMIGDTTYDMEMARHAGVQPIGVAWGYHDAAALHKAGAAVVLNDWSELLRLLDESR